jgi:signal peptidase II
MEIKNNSIKEYYIIAIALVFIDQLTKIAIKGFSLFGIEHKGMSLGQSIPVIGDLLRITYVENQGMAFGIEFGILKILLSLFSVAASILLVILIKKLKDSDAYVKIGFALILAGAAGNLIDRVFYGVIYGGFPLFYGRVVDFLEFDIPDIELWGNLWTHFPVFNVADSCVTLGVIILLLFHKRIPNLSDLFKKYPKPQQLSTDIHDNDL